MIKDLRFVLRQLAKTPGFFAVAVLTLAVGIGCSSAMFSALCALVVKPFSYPESDRIVQVWSNQGQPFSVPDYFDMKEQTTVFEEFGAYNINGLNLGGEHAQSVIGVSCTAGVLRAFGIPPALGRWFEPADEQPGAAQVVILSQRVWKESFAGDPGMIGRSIRLNGGSARVVGIMPSGFEFSAPWMRTDVCQLWIPLQLKRGEDNRGSHSYCVVARLKGGVSLGAADSEVKAIGARLKAAYPNTNSHKPFFVRSLHDEMTTVLRSEVWMLFIAVVLVLLVACANVSSMLLARNARRQGEIGVRLALGASRSHILRLALTEGFLLALAGSAIGLGLAYGGVKALQVVAPVSELRKAAIVLDGRVFLFAVGLTFLTALLAGLPPAFAALRISVVDMLRTDCRGAAGSRTRHRLLRGLIIGQVALAFVLANGAALFSASYAKLLADNSNFATDSVLSARINLQGERYSTSESRARFFEQVAARAASLPGVTDAGVTSKLPLEGGSNMNILVNDEVFDPTARRILAECSGVTPSYFSAIGVAVIRGRALEARDAGKDEIGVVVNRTLAEKCWPKQDPLGRLIRPNSEKPWYHARVVGVVEDLRQWGADSAPRPEMYWTAERAWGRRLFIVVRASGSAAPLASALRRELTAMDPDLSLARVRTMQAVLTDSTQGQRTVAGLVDFFMVVALGLVAIGLFGTLSYHVLQNTREIGVRMALGALPGQILRQVLRQGFLWVFAGVLIGVCAALALAKTLHSMVYGVDTIHVLTLLGATLAVAAATLLACWIPARRASRVDPMVALRSD